MITRNNFQMCPTEQWVSHQLMLSQNSGVTLSPADQDIMWVYKCTPLYTGQQNTMTPIKILTFYKSNKKNILKNFRMYISMIMSRILLNLNIKFIVLNDECSSWLVTVQLWVWKLVLFFMSFIVNCGALNLSEIQRSYDC